jgi:hypothetical protein
LGNKIVEELGQDQSRDTLARWMAHYIAELIEAARRATGEDQQTRMDMCARAILDLWRHQTLLPTGTRPFEELAPILRTLESLDPNPDNLRYYRLQIAAIHDDAEEEETKRWLRIAKHLDFSARILIRYCLTCAADSALNKSEEWVALSQAAGLEEEVELQTFRLLVEERDLLKANTADEIKRKEIADRITRLEQVREMMSQVLAHLQEHL